MKDLKNYKTDDVLFFLKKYVINGFHCFLHYKDALEDLGTNTGIIELLGYEEDFVAAGYYNENKKIEQAVFTKLYWYNPSITVLNTEKVNFENV